MAGATRVAGIMGWPVGHSLSPRLHRHWFEAHGIDGAYVPLAVAPERLETALRALPALGFAGCNVTIPHKERAFALVDAHDDAALAMGAVNTVLVQDDGRLYGRNTDGLGFLAHLRATLPDLRLEGARALVLGTGGAARAIGRVLLEAGVEPLLLANRTEARAHALADFLGGGEVVAWERREAALEGVDLLVNATSLGMAGQPPLALDLAALPAHAAVDDIVYRPTETDLLKAARARGNSVVDGLGMLLHQAVPGFAHWGGVTPAVDRAAREALLAGL